MADNFGTCEWCKEKIEEQPFVFKAYPAIDKMLPYHSACFVVVHSGLMQNATNIVNAGIDAQEKEVAHG